MQVCSAERYFTLYVLKLLEFADLQNVDSVNWLLDYLDNRFRKLRNQDILLKLSRQLSSYLVVEICQPRMPA